MAGAALANKRPGIAAGPFAFHMARSYDSACFTRSGENGTRLIRTPVASNTALAMAADSGRIEGSPAPVGGSSGWSIRANSIWTRLSINI